nr:zinc finger BED domain-containing protein RICESLEEPER 2-like [Tanacetum cinerariifolium]
MASESASLSTATGVGSTSAPTIREIISTNQKPSDLERLQPLHNDRQLAKSSMQALLSFLIASSNTMLRSHITHPHCEVITEQKNQNREARQTSMARDESVFRFDSDYLREQFASLVIQRALPFNHFDHEQTTRVFQNTMQPKYTHVSHSTLKRDAMRLWFAAKQEIIDSLLCIFDFSSVNSSGGATHQLSSGNISSLAVAK